MPKIPKAVQQRQLATTPTATAQDPSGFTQVTKAVGELGKVFGQVGEAFQKAKDFRQSTEAKVKYNKAVGDSLLLAEQDKNPDNVDFHLQQLEEIRLTASDGIDNDLEKFKVQAEADIFIDTKRLDVNRGFIKKQLDANNATLLEYVAELEDKFIKSEFETERRTIISLRDQQIEQAIELGIIDREAAQKWKVKLNESWKEINFQRDLYPDPQTQAPPDLLDVQAKLARNFYGFNQKQRIEAGKDLEQAFVREERKQAAQLKTIQSKEEGVLLGKVLDGTTGPGEVLQRLNAEFISPQAAENMLEIILFGKAKGRDDTTTSIYKDVSQAMLSESDFQQMNFIIMKSVASKGGISINQANSLKNMVDVLEAGSTKTPALQRFLSAWLKATEFTSPAIVVSVMAEKAFRQIWPGEGKEVSFEQAQKITKEITRENILEQHPQLSGHEKIPNIILEQGKGFNVISNQPVEGGAEFFFNAETQKIERR